jgi:hypothetical protein
MISSHGNPVKRFVQIKKAPLLSFCLLHLLSVVTIMAKNNIRKQIMPRIIAFKCRWTKKVFTDKQKYLKHLIKQREVLVLAREAARVNRTMQAKFIQMREECESLADIEKFITENWEVFFHNGVNHDSWRDRRGKYRKPNLLSVKVTGRFSYHISNSHSAPIGKPLNWGSKPGIPTGYPGFAGDITWQLDGEYQSFGSDVMQGTGINTGSGGGRGHHGFGYDMKLFLDDWPGLARARVIEKLSRSDDDVNTY